MIQQPQSYAPQSRNIATRHALVWGSVLLLIVVDQIIKIWIKTHMIIGEEIRVLDWFRIYFIENEGFAFGITLGSKLFLTLFRIVAMGLVSWGVVRLTRAQQFSKGFLVVLALIVAGGFGNIVDSIFYGVIFSSSHGTLAEFMPTEGGYAPLFYGHVVDMFYCPIIDWYLPQWIPFVGGKHFTFFDPIFNFADACISVGTVLLLLFYYSSLGKALEYLFPQRKESSQVPPQPEA